MTTVNVPSAGTVWSPAVPLSQSEPLLSPPVVWPCTSRPPDTDTVTLSSAPSRLSVAVFPVIDAEATAALAGEAAAARLAANAAPSAARIPMRFMLGPPDLGLPSTSRTPGGRVSARRRVAQRAHGGDRRGIIRAACRGPSTRRRSAITSTGSFGRRGRCAAPARTPRTSSRRPTSGSCGGRALVRREDDLGYLYRRLRHTYFNARRTASRRPQVAAQLDDVQTASWRADLQPEQAAETNLVLEAVAALPEPMREVLVAVDVVGLSYAEAGRRSASTRTPSPAGSRGPGSRSRRRCEDDREAAEKRPRRGH